MFFYNKINSKKFKKFNLKGIKQNKKKVMFWFFGFTGFRYWSPKHQTNRYLYSNFAKKAEAAGW
jgi:hypothetical protein